ncbi:unnamed protein product [Camellia sinensis]
MGGYARSSSSRSSHDTITVYSRQSYCTSIPRTTHQKLNSSSPSTDSKSERNAIMIAFFAVLFIVVMIFSSQSKDSVLMVQVAFDGATDQIERDLDLISMVSDTQTALGIHLMISKTVNMKRPWKEIFDRTYEEERKKVNTFVGAVKVLWTSQDDIEDFPSLKH